MGNNCDLIKMLGIKPEDIKCPICNNTEHKWKWYLDDYDIECGDPNPEEGVWELSFNCHNCDNDFSARFRLLTGVIKFTRER